MNVIPESCTAHVNFRYAPGRTPREAEKRLEGLTQGLGELEFGGNSPSAPVAPDHPLAQKLIAAGSLTVAPKQAWTPVAEFATAGFPAINFGPGETVAGPPPRRVDPDRQPRQELQRARGVRHVIRLSPVLTGSARTRSSSSRRPARGCAPPASS